MNRIFYFFLKFLPNSLILFVRTFKLLMSGDYLKIRRRIEENTYAIRRNSSLNLQRLETRTLSYRFNDTINQREATVFSQNGEDGILLFVFSQLGHGQRHFVEFGIGDGRQCISANLAINYGWKGLFLEVDPDKAKAAQYYYHQVIGSSPEDIRVLQKKVTRENINKLIAEGSPSSEVDLLCIDIDGNDYWVWEAVSTISPRVVVIEYNATFGDTVSITIPYDPEFQLLRAHPSGYYHGASLAALTKLAEKKGYTLIGCESSGVNAFYLREDLINGQLRPVSVQKAFFKHIWRSDRMDPSDQWKRIQHLDFVEV